MSNWCERRRQVLPASVAVLCGVVFFFQAYFSAQQKSLTWDEPSFIGAGYTYLTLNDFRLNPSHPPLLQVLAALPLVFSDVNAPEQDLDYWLSTPNPAVAYGRTLVYQNGNDVELLASRARLPIITLCSALIVMMFFWGRELYGTAPALAGTVLAVFSPNLLAHSRLATEDAGCTVLMFAAVWTFWTAMRKRQNLAWGICGTVTGLALLSKYTALLLGPIYFLLVVGNWLLTREPAVTRAKLCGFAIVGVLSLTVVGCGYNFTFNWRAYMDGVFKIYTDTYPDYLHYLLGETSPDPWWYYYIVAFLLKVPVSTLLLLILALGCAVYGRRRPEAALYLLVPPSVVIGASFFDAHNLGLRRILPAFPFLFLFIATTWDTALHLRPKWRNGCITVLAILVALSALEGARIYPHYLAYFNFIGGGPERGPFLLSDSSLDFGQDLPALARWQQDNPDALPMRIHYHGSQLAPHAYGVKATKFTPALVEDLATPRPGYYAISAHELVTYRKMSEQNGREVDWLSRFHPLARVGYSIYIYRFPQSDSAQQ